jgi:superfamily II DNA or RNA helicase
MLSACSALYNHEMRPERGMPTRSIQRVSENNGLTLTFDAGSLVLDGTGEDNPLRIPGVVYDHRTRQLRAEGCWYRKIIQFFQDNKTAYVDQAKEYKLTRWPIRIEKKAFPHQTEGLKAWLDADKQGVVVLPTGTGKTHLANLAINAAERPSLVVTPTIDLMNQWYDELTLCFQADVGLVGGGYHEIKPLTVTTYDSAYQNVDRLGNKFGLIIFDECHHLPGPTYGWSARGAIAPFRLGLTATPERADNAHEHLDQLIGPIVYRKEITQLRGQFLAEYRIETLYADLTPEERHRYETSRTIYREFLSSTGIDMRKPGAWGHFLMAAHRSAEGRQAYLAYREQRALAQAAPAKLKVLERLLERHNGDRVIIFTNDNATVYTIARRFLVPVITHQTKTKERREVLLRFNSGAYPIVATSKVLNEGVNVPEANVAIILSGSGSVREHVQRLGRILRKSGDKEATLYEVITRGTVEEFTSNRRRQHSAYGGD